LVFPHAQGAKPLEALHACGFGVQHWRQSSASNSRIAMRAEMKSNNTRIFIVGKTSYLGTKLRETLGKSFEVLHLAYPELDHLRADSSDVIINCCFDPDHFLEPLNGGLGLEAQPLFLARDSGARYVMLSSRAVYPTGLSPPLTEKSPCSPTTVYGRNKLDMEAGVSGILGDQALVLRLANVFGEEPPGRHTFVSTALASLRDSGVINIAMAPETRKDFVPVAFVGHALAALLNENAGGIFNIGSGHAISVKAVAAALIRGYGRGDIRVSRQTRGESFCLDNERLNRHTGLAIGEEEILEHFEKAAYASIS